MAKIRINPEATEYDVEVPGGEMFGNFPMDGGDQLLVTEDGRLFLAVGGDHDTLEADSLYELVKLGCEIETGVELGEGADEDDDEDDEDDGDDEGEDA